MTEVVSLFQYFDSEKLKKKYAVDPLLSSLASLERESVIEVLRHYRYFTHHYIQDMAVLIAKMPFGRLRSLLADFLSEELGTREPTAAHPALYDDFLRGLGCSEKQLLNRNPYICEPLEKVTRLVETSDWLVGLGLRGLGGECLCQVYLESAYSFLCQNPHLKMQDVPTKFWDIHAGAIDQEHRLTTLEAMAELFSIDRQAEAVVRSSFEVADQAWEQFWQRAFASLRNERRLTGGMT